MNDFYNKHYITIDDQGRITAGWSDGPHPEQDVTNAICINKQGGYQFRLLVKFTDIDGEPWHQQTEENPPLFTMDGIPLYRWDGEQAVPRMEEEVAADLAAIPAPPTPGPTQLDRVEAQAAYTAMMTDTLLEV